MELFVWPHELGSLLLEPLTLRRVVRDSVVDQVFDKAVHPARLVINLVDFFDLLDAWDFQMLYVNSTKRAIHCRCRPRKSVGASILVSRDVVDAKAFECHYQGLHLV